MLTTSVISRSGLLSRYARPSLKVYQRFYHHSHFRLERRIPCSIRLWTPGGISSHYFSSSSSSLRGEEPAAFSDHSEQSATHFKSGTNSDGVLDTVVEGDSDLFSESSDSFAVNEEFVDAALQESVDTGFSFSSLCSWAPDLVRSLLENIHSISGAPWWLTIIVGSVCIRTLLLPVVGYSRKNAKRMAVIQPQIVKLQGQLMASFHAKDYVRMDESRKKMKDLYKEHNVRPALNLVPIFGQGILLSCFFFAIRRMAAAPVEGFSNGGLFWFTDLCVPDPYFILPVINFAILTTSILRNSSDMEVNEDMKKAMLAMFSVLFVATTQFSSGLCVYLVSSSSFSLAYGTIYKYLIKSKAEQSKDIPAPKRMIEDGPVKRVVHNNKASHKKKVHKKVSKKHMY